eukprot:scaffold2422_cov56-Attheya_sp.AAC.13
MDIAGGMLGFQGLEVFRTVETKNKNTTEVVFFSMVLIMSDGGEGILFNTEKAVQKIIEACGLTETAKIRLIRMAMATADGFQMTKRTTIMQVANFL